MFSDVVDRVQGLDDAALRAELRAIEAQRRTMAAHEAAVLAELEQRRLHRNDGHATMYGLLRTDVGWSNAECKQRTRIAQLVVDHPDLGESLHETRVGVAHAAELARLNARAELDDPLAGRIGELARAAERYEFDDFRAICQTFERDAHPESASEAAASAAEHRRARCELRHDGCGELTATLPTIDAVKIHEILEMFTNAEWHADYEAAVAEHGENPGAHLLARTTAQRRADALVKIFERAVATPAGSRAPEAAVNVHVDYQSDLNILAEAELIPERQSDPFDDPTAHVTHLTCRTSNGHALDHDTVFQALLEGHVRYVIRNQQGIPINWGRKKRFFAGAARDAIRSLTTRCTHPGCRVPVDVTDTDHTTPWSAGGSTDACNSNPRCRKHNLLRNHGYEVTYDAPMRTWHTYRPDGTLIA